MYKSYFFLQISNFLFDLCNIFYVLESRNMVYVIRSHNRGKVEKYSEKNQRTEAADTMHNVIIPSGRVENRQLENQSLLTISQLLAQRERGAVRSRTQFKNENPFV